MRQFLTSRASSWGVHLPPCVSWAAARLLWIKTTVTWRTWVASLWKEIALVTWSDSPRSGRQLIEGCSTLLGKVIAQALAFHNLFFEEGGGKSILFTFQTPGRMSVNLTFINFERQAKELLSHLDLFGQAAGVGFLQTPDFLFWVWELLSLAWVFHCLVLVLSLIALFKSGL